MEIVLENTVSEVMVVLPYTISVVQVSSSLSSNTVVAASEPLLIYVTKIVGLGTPLFGGSR